MILLRARRVHSLIIAVILASSIAHADASASASAPFEAPHAAETGFGEARRFNSTGDPEASPSSSARSAPSADSRKNDLLHRPPKHDPNPAWSRRWAFSVGIFALVVFGILAFAWRELKGAIQTRSRELFPVLAAFAVALALRLATPLGPSNWHTHLYIGDNFARFGPGTWVVQAGLWSLFSPSDVVLGRAYAVIGALSVPLLYAILRSAKASVTVATSVAVFWALSPVHIRISASFSEHVLSSTLTFLLLLVALRRGAYALAFSALLICAIGLCRFDAWPQLAMVPVWIALLDARDEPRSWPSRLLTAWPYFAVWIFCGIVIKQIFLREGLSHPMPTPSEMLAEFLGLTRWVSHYFEVAIESPHWFSPVAALSMIPGAIWMARKRPLFLVALVASLLISFVPLARTPGELVTSRYFLPALALLLIPAAYGLEWLLVRTKLENPWPVRGLVYLGALALSVPALSYRYTFQDEYQFLHRELARLSPTCTVVTLPVRHSSMPRDLDCCMALPNSSLGLAFPRMNLIELEDQDERFDDLGTECVVYYENPICNLDPGPEWENMLDETKAIFRERCARIRASHRLEPIAFEEFSRVSVNPRPLFQEEAARGTLYRVIQAPRDSSKSSAPAL